MITVLKGGCGTRHPMKFIMSRDEGLDNYLLLIIRCKSLFIIDGVEYSVEENSAVIISPNISYYYSNPNGLYSDDWLHWNCKINDLDNFNLPAFNIPFRISDHTIYTTYIQQILWEQSYNDSAYSKENINSLFNIIFNHLYNAYENRDVQIERGGHLEKLQYIRLYIQNRISEKHQLSEMAAITGLSPSYFQFLYRKYFNISFQQDVIQMRIEYAVHLLKTTNFSMEEISESCGYLNHVHFFRQFKKSIGMTPAKYRTSYQ